MANRGKGRGKAKSDAPTLLIDFLRPHDPDKVIKMAQEHLEGKDVSGRINSARMSIKDYEALEIAINKGGDKAPVTPNLYNPVLAQIGKDIAKTGREVLFALPGQESKCILRPAKWDDKVLGPWEKGMKLDAFRLQHVADVRKLVVDGALVKVGAFEFVAGAKIGDEWVAAIFNINGSKTGNYGHNCRAVKSLTFESITDVDGNKVNKTDVANLVGRINNVPKILKLENGSDLPIMPNNHTEWGYLVKDGKNLTPAQVHALKENKGVSFVALKRGRGFVGFGVTGTEFWKVVKREMSAAATKDDTELTALDRFGNRPKRSEVRTGPCPGA